MKLSTPRLLAMMLAAMMSVTSVTSGMEIPGKRIINGSPAELYSHPYIASIQMDYGEGYGWGHICGGSLIDREWILTAAHCVDTVSPNQLDTLRVELGAMNLYVSPNDYEHTLGVSQVIVHKGWDGNARGMPNDIALLRLSAKATLNNNVKIAKLADGSESFLNTECVLAGWGQIATGENAMLASDLKEVEITKISSNTCNRLWFGFLRRGITDKHICVHDLTPPVGDRPSACMGDSGGPMMCGPGHDHLAGVTSWGESSCSGDKPSVYTRVSAYRGWIQDNTGLTL